MAKKASKDARRRVKLAQITLDKELQPRQALTQEAVQEYAEAMTEGQALPPCIVVSDGKSFWCCDGFHRIAAARSIGATDIECEIIEGTRQDAMWIAASANRTHGVRRTNTDKRRAVAMALAVRPDASLRDIAEHCAVTHEMVRTVKGQLEAIDAVEDAAVAAVNDAIEEEVIEAGDEVSQGMVAAEAAIEQAMDAVQQCVRRVEALLATRHAVFVNGQSVVNDLRNARSGLKQSLPHERCPVCGGDGCDTCRSVGWVSKKQWDLIPKTQRGGK